MTKMELVFLKELIGYHELQAKKTANEIDGLKLWLIEESEMIIYKHRMMQKHITWAIFLNRILESETTTTTQGGTP